MRQREKPIPTIGMKRETTYYCTVVIRGAKNRFSCKTERGARAISPLAESLVLRCGETWEAAYRRAHELVTDLEKSSVFNEHFPVGLGSSGLESTQHERSPGLHADLRVLMAADPDYAKQFTSGDPLPPEAIDKMYGWLMARKITSREQFENYLINNAHLEPVYSSLLYREGTSDE